MTRIIKASEVKPGMTIRVEHLEVKHELTVSYVAPEMGTGSVEARTKLGGSIYLPDCKPVTVLSEPQPEEPTEFGAKVIVDGQRFLRAPLHSNDLAPWVSQLDGRWRGWPAILAMGTVTVIPDQGWTVPTDTETAPVVPDRIEEWPEDDEHLRDHEWKDSVGDVWSSRNGRWGYHSDGTNWCPTLHTCPYDGPWTRATDA